ncbi:enoyl-CoA hydratase/isomerase family protein [Leucobacter aridicollis]|uniref:enoyl-CoA hydratase/isomerase family protein n=1 Tax=Leucobacter aridicollis TaxID=283878 RepID=UPI002104AC47|nr:enoyl-CoA hydratase/isomerase family protein [Leucobacter aridicollis]UTX53542.1 enoyl-CoA hydratase/isomerase family protein [Leucobacter aridicollis]
MTDVPALDTIRLEFDGDLLIATLSRPSRANAVSRQMLRELIELADWLDGNEAVRFLILTGDGPIFAAGQDLQEMREPLSDESQARAAMRALQRLAQEVMHKLEGLEQIAFAVIQGSAYGAGVAIAMTADFRLMAADAVLNLPETNLGMFLTYGATPRLVSVMGASAAKEFVMFARDMPAADALRHGLVNVVAPRGELMAAALAQVNELRGKDFRSLRITKRIAQAAAAVNVGDILVGEPELSEGALSDGTTLELVDRFFKNKR